MSIAKKLEVRTKLEKQQIIDVVKKLEGRYDYWSARIMYADDCHEFSELLYDGGEVLLGNVKFGVAPKPREGISGRFPNFAVGLPAVVLLPSGQILVYDPIQ